MQKTDIYDELVERIYTTADMPNAPTAELATDTRWSDVLAQLAPAAAVDAIGLSHDADIRLRRTPASVGVSATLAEAYPRRHQEDVLWSRTVCYPRSDHAANVLSMRFLERTQMYEEWIRPQGWRTTLHLQICPDLGCALLIGRQSAGAPPPSAAALLVRLAPHFRRAISAQLETARVRQLAEAATGVLDALPVGIIVVDASTGIVVANRRAEEIARANGIRLDHGRVQLPASRLQTRLEAALLARISTSLPMPRLGRRDLHLVLVPLEARDGAPTQAGSMAILMSDPDRPIEVSSDLLASLHGLTPAQAALAALVVQGKAPEECAAILDLTLGTVRDRMKQILARTGTNRQAQLVSVIMRSIALLHRPDR